MKKQNNDIKQYTINENNGFQEVDQEQEQKQMLDSLRDLNNLKDYKVFMAENCYFNKWYPILRDKQGNIIYDKNGNAKRSESEKGLSISYYTGKGQKDQINITNKEFLALLAKYTDQDFYKSLITNDLLDFGTFTEQGPDRLKDNICEILPNTPLVFRSVKVLDQDFRPVIIKCIYIDDENQEQEIDITLYQGQEINGLMLGIKKDKPKQKTK